MSIRNSARLGYIVIAALAVAIAGGCSKGQSSGEASSGTQGKSGQERSAGAGGRRSAVVPVQAVTARIGLLSVDRTTAGVVNPVVQSQVAAQVAGVVLKVPHLVGDWVKKGELVVQLDETQLKLSLASAQAALENAKINLSMGTDTATQANPKLALQVQSAQAAYDSAKKFYDSQKALFDLGGISASQLDTATSQLAQAQASLEGAKTDLEQNNKATDWSIAQLKLAVTQAQNQYDQASLNLQYARICAPFSGQLAAINMQPGMYTALNTPVFTLVSVEREVNFNVPPSDTPFLKIGSSVNFVYQGKNYPIKVSQAPSAPISGSVPMVASGGSSFAFGSVGTVSYRIPLATGLILPLSSLATLENNNYVFIIQDGKAAVKNVTIVAEGGSDAVVQGISEGDVVIVSPPPGLIQGSQIQPTMLDASTEGTPAKSAKPTGTKQAGNP
jgi:RND family efflux transporter MFP subunit